eukprot:scaffold25672_cov90-Isochrysis_galbana.AAC.2
MARGCVCPPRSSTCARSTRRYGILARFSPCWPCSGAALSGLLADAPHPPHVVLTRAVAVAQLQRPIRRRVRRRRVHHLHGARVAQEGLRLGARLCVGH